MFSRPLDTFCELRRVVSPDEFLVSFTVFARPPTHVMPKRATQAFSSEDAQVADAPDKRAPDVNRQVHAQVDPDKEARAKAPRSGPHP